MYRNNDLPITTGTRLILTDPRLPFDKNNLVSHQIIISIINLCASRFNVELVQDKETSTFILRIRDIQETDGATYQCQVLFF